MQCICAVEKKAEDWKIGKIEGGKIERRIIDPNVSILLVCLLLSIEFKILKLIPLNPYLQELPILGINISN